MEKFATSRMLHKLKCVMSLKVIYVLKEKHAIGMTKAKEDD